MKLVRLIGAIITMALSVEALKEQTVRHEFSRLDAPHERRCLAG